MLMHINVISIRIVNTKKFSWTWIWNRWIWTWWLHYIIAASLPDNAL